MHMQFHTTQGHSRNKVFAMQNFSAKPLATRVFFLENVVWGGGVLLWGEKMQKKTSKKQKKKKNVIAWGEI